MKKKAGIPPILKKIMLAKALAGAGAGGPPPGAGGPPPGMGAPPPPAMKKGGAVKGFAKGGSIDGCASRGKTKTSMVKMKKGGRC